MKQREMMMPILPAPDARKQTKHMVLMASVATAKSIVAHADAWAAKLDGKADLTRGAATRKRLAGGEGGSTVAMAVSPTNQLVASIELAAKVHATNHHEVLAWCVNRGIGEVSTEMLEAAFPGRRPSFSLVGVLALKLGLDRIDEFKPSPKAADGSVVGGRASGGKWPKRGEAFDLKRAFPDKKKVFLQQIVGKQSPPLKQVGVHYILLGDNGTFYIREAGDLTPVFPLEGQEAAFVIKDYVD